MSITNNTTELQSILEMVNALPDALDTSDADAVAEDIAEGKTAYVNGEKITGTATESEPTLQSKTVTPTTSTQTVTPDTGYDGLSQVTVNAMPTATQATPTISVSSAGLITASATQPAGYVSAGTKSATKQLTVQAAKTVTPTTSNQTAVASGRYTTGAITVKGDSNLKAANIKSGVTIFNVTGTYTGETPTTKQQSVTISSYSSVSSTVTVSGLSTIYYVHLFGVGTNSGGYPVIINLQYTGTDTDFIQVDGNQVTYRHNTSGMTSGVTGDLTVVGV